jgi:hypothetical protein
MTGLFILSLDTEIAWGTYGAHNLSRLSHCFNAYRDYFPRLVALLDTYEIPATWAVVGHLFLDHCDGHPDVPQPHYAWSAAPDSYRDPCTSLERAPWYYGPDIIAQIRAAKMPHEIGTHTFTHVIAADPAVTPSLWDAQLAACAKVHARHGLPMRSIVYPQDKIAYTERLSDFGIIAYRGNERRWYTSLPRRYKRVFHLLRALAFTPPTYDPSKLQVGERLVDLPSSQFLMAYDGIRSLIPTAARVRQARLGIEKAVQRDELYHLWFHPFNLGTSDKMFDALEQILRIVVRFRDEGKLQIMTMNDAAEWILDGMPGADRGPEPYLREEWV